ncbi:hypothetical protein L1049_018098 [Liquidambar formosana]|uniref:C2H2-type domain-containing protein n=1 Tax=Liquidambar formosana TaxID=63359 RepID=A0AAP0NK78_LIQFO
MEKHKCKLCFKSFANGRALGGHMRSHMMNLPIQPKPHQQPIQLKEVEAESADSASASSSSSSEDEGEEKLLGYGLRENPKKSFRLVDPEFSFAIDGGSVSVVVQDRESETESSKNPTRRRSKRTRKLCNAERQCQQQEQETTKKVKFYKPINSKAESWAEPEPVSSISDATTEEDVAFCLMMLSRDKWMKDEEEGEGEEEEEEEKSMEEYLYEYEETKPCKTNRVKGKFYKCETCKKTFRSYQALGGHRASHKKIRLLGKCSCSSRYCYYHYSY